MNKLRRAVFTISTNQKLPWVQLLFETLQKHDHNCDIILGLVDRQSDCPYPDNCTILPVEDIGLPNQTHFLFRYNPFNLCTAVKPYYFNHLFEKGYENVIYLDSDIALFESLDQYFRLLEAEIDFVMTPHFLEPPTQRDQPNEISILQHGTFNLGFIGIHRSTTSRPLVTWWAKMLEFNCVTMIEQGAFADQKFIDLIPSFTSRYAIIRDPGANYAYWNMSRRVVTVADGKFLVNDKPLIFCHFSGFDLKQPTELSAYGSKIRPQNDAGLNALVAWYAENLTRLGAHTYVAPSYGFGQFASGTCIPEKLREIFRQSINDSSLNPFEDSLLENGSRTLEPQSPPVVGQTLSAYDMREHLLFALKELETRTHHAQSLLTENEALKSKLAGYEQQ
ncbi:putative nucleotide-diphospho-sugar transferase [Methylobacterium sp. SI9]|uniref:putative nucleotide-diphospho-sugar transferase n=1 Tax=Methylobacterium guangdongense TaxID=3138811 RepID=UPI00313CE829